MKLVQYLSAGALAFAVTASIAGSPAKVEPSKHEIAPMPQPVIKELASALKKDKRIGYFNIKGYDVYLPGGGSCAFLVRQPTSGTWFVGNKCTTPLKFTVKWSNTAPYTSDCLGYYWEQDTLRSFTTTYAVRVDQFSC